MHFGVQSIYDSCPVFVQNLAVNAYAFKIHWREYGRPFEKALRESEARQWASADEIEAYQDEQLNLLIEHCFRNVPYYRRIMNERGLTPKDITSHRHISKLPLLTRGDVRTNFKELLATNLLRSDMIPGNTSGTTGTTLELMYDRRICRMKTALDWRQKKGGRTECWSQVFIILGPLC